MIQFSELYPEVLLPEATAEVNFEAWLDLARQCLLAAWMHCFEGRCYFYRLGEIHEYSDCLISVQADPENYFLGWAQMALEQALGLNSRHLAAQYCFFLIKWLLSPTPGDRQNALQKLAQIPAFPSDPNRSKAFLHSAQTHAAELTRPLIQALKQDKKLRENFGIDLPLPEFPLVQLGNLTLSAAHIAKAFAARIRLLLGETPALSLQMGWRTGLIRMLMSSENYGQAGHWDITCFGPMDDPFKSQAESLGRVQSDKLLQETSDTGADLVTLWHLRCFDADAQGQIQRAWQGLKPEGLLLAAFSRSEVEPATLRNALADLTGSEVDLIDRESFCDRLVVAIWKKALPPIDLHVLIVMRPDSALSFGGADLQMFRSRARLRQLGIQTDISLACRLDFEDYDLIYAVGYLHNQYQFRLLKTTTKPVVGMPIATLFYLESALAEEIYSQIHLQVGNPLNQNSAVSPHLLNWLSHWQLGPIWQKIKSDWQKTGMKAKIDKISGQFASVCDFLVPQAQSEMTYLQAQCSDPLPPYRLLPNGCDPDLYAQADPNLFEQTHGLKDFLLCVGRIEPNKNQLLLCYALRETEIPIVLVGKESSELFQDYLALCRYLGNGRIHVLQDLSDAMLASAYASAKLFVLPSASESFPLSTLEAAWAGCPVVLSQNSVQGEFFQDCFYSLDPLNPQSIKSVVETAWQADNLSRSKLAQTLVQTQCTWEKMARDLKAVFLALKALDPRQSGLKPMWDGEEMCVLIKTLKGPQVQMGIKQVYRLSDLSEVWALTERERAAYLQHTFEVYSDLARFQLQALGFKQVEVLNLPPSQRHKSGGMMGPAPHLLCLYHPTDLYGHRACIAAFLQVFSPESAARLTLYLPEERDLNQIESELLAQIEALGHNPEQIPELAVITGGLTELEERALWDSVSLIVFPLKRLWGHEALLERLVASGMPLLTQGFWADWPDLERGIQVLTPFEVLCQAPPEALIEIEAAQLAAVIGSLAWVE